MAGEITCISDDDVDRRNPVEHLSRALLQRSEAHRLQGSLTVRIDGEYAKPRLQNSDVRLRLPPPHQFKQYIFTREFDEFLARIAASPREHHQLRVNNEHASVTIGYAPTASRNFSMSYPSYNATRDLVRNPLYNRLKKKVDQINASGHASADGFRGVLVCDGGTGLFGATVGVGVRSRHQIANHFLRKTRSLDFIALLSVDAAVGYPQRYAYTVEIIDRCTSVAASFGHLLEEGLRQIPQALRTPTNARHHHAWKREHGITTLSHGEHAHGSPGAAELRVSSRAVFDFIAGRMEREWFERLAGHWMLSLLRRDLDAGAMVRSVEFRRRDEQDDDELLIKWSLDPAATPYTTDEPT